MEEAPADDASGSGSPTPVSVQNEVENEVRNEAGNEPEVEKAGEDRTDPPAAEGILVAVYGAADVGAETAESILLGEFSKRGYTMMDRTTLDPVSASTGIPMDSEQLAFLRTESGVAVVIVADLRAEATPSVGSMYTGRATLSARIYDTETRRLIGTRTFQVGAGNTPGKIGASPVAASNEAVTQVAYQAATGLAREIRLLADR